MQPYSNCERYQTEVRGDDAPVVAELEAFQNTAAYIAVNMPFFFNYLLISSHRLAMILLMAVLPIIILLRQLYYCQVSFDLLIDLTTKTE